MLVIPKKDFPKLLNPVGLKRGDKVEIEIGEVSPDFITLDPSTLKLDAVRNPMEHREPLVKASKPKMSTMPLPDLKNMIQKPPMLPPPSTSPMTPPPAPMPPMK